MSARGQYGRVPVAPVREAFEASDVSAYEVALRLGWFHQARHHKTACPDSYRVRRALGIAPYPPGRDRRGVPYPPKVRTHIAACTASAILGAIGVIPAEVGL
jgi:hypothetical protein